MIQEISAKSSPAFPLATASAAPRVRPGHFEKLLLRILAPMQRGHLVLEGPGGTVREFGSAGNTAGRRLPPGISGTAVIRVRDDVFFRKCILSGDVGFGEAYMDGDWDTPDLTAVIAWFLLNVADAPTLSGSARKHAGGWLLNVMRWGNRLRHLRRPNSRAGVTSNIREHYDVSNAFFAQFLDPSMMYSCAQWTHTEQTLEDAQRAKNETLCQMLRLRPTDHVLEIGSGWGGWAIHAARHHGSRITTITVSEQQFTEAWDRVQAAGVSDRVDVQLIDFRDLRGTYDKIVSIEMMEALGHRYLPDFCRFLSRALKPEGLAALQFITCPDARYAEFRRGVDFIQKHIFPGSLLLSLNRVNEQLAQAGGFVVNQVSDRGHDYARTLRAWRENLERHREAVAGLGFDERFLRKWRYYLGYCEAAFALRNISVVQALYTRPNNLTL